MKKKYFVWVFNTLTSRYEKITVSKAIYNEFRRGEWRISKNNDKHKTNETPFSQLIGGDDGAYENFHEFITGKDELVDDLRKRELIDQMYSAISKLPDGEREVIELFYFQNYTSCEIGKIIGITQQAVTKRRRSAHKHLKNFLKKF